MDKELERCKFCGGNGTILEYSHSAYIDDKTYSIKCDKCGISTIKLLDGKDYLIKMWNKKIGDEK